MEADHLLYLSAFLFCTGLATVIIKRNAIVILLGIELMLNAANINLLAFNQNTSDSDAPLFVLFVIIVAVCETAIGMAIILKTYQHFGSAIPDHMTDLKENN